MCMVGMNLRHRLSKKDNQLTEQWSLKQNVQGMFPPGVLVSHERPGAISG